MVTIGTGQHASTAEAMIELNAGVRGDGRQLRRVLLADRQEDEGTAIAVLRWRWLLYNLVNISWAFLTAVFVIWSAYWLPLNNFGASLDEWVLGLADWEALSGRG